MRRCHATLTYGTQCRGGEPYQDFIQAIVTYQVAQTNALVSYH